MTTSYAAPWSPSNNERYTEFTQLIGKVVEGYLKRLSKVKQFEGTATKY
jgi:hypothetical protein